MPKTPSGTSGSGQAAALAPGLRGGQRVHVLICDDCVITRAGLEAVVHSTPDLIVVGVAENSFRAAELSRRLAPHVALVALNSAGAARRTIRALRRGGAGVVVLGRPGAGVGVVEAHGLGARSYLPAAVGTARLIEVIRAVARGESLLDPRVVGVLLLADQDRLRDSAPLVRWRPLVWFGREARITALHVASLVRCRTTARTNRLSRIC